MTLLLVTVAAFGCAKVWNRHRQQQLVVAQCAQITNTEAATSPRRAAVLATSTAPVLAVLGDSYAQGNTLDDPLRAWPYLVADARSERAFVAAVGGSGYTVSGPCQGNVFADRVPDVVAARPSVVIVEGGIGDEGRTGVQGAATDVLRALRQQLPDARIVALSPFTSPGRPNPDDAADAIRAAAEAAGAEFVSVSDLTFEVQGDDIHPTNRGQQQIADAVVRAL